MKKKLKVAAAPKSSDLAKTKIALVVSQYHSELTNSMAKACTDVLLKNGLRQENIVVLPAPGSWEIPLIAAKAAKSKKFSGIAAFGVIVKGETYHFEMIANEVARALMDISTAHQLPVALEVLAVYKLAQAKERSQGEYNKGIEAANALLETIYTLRKM